MRRVDEVDRGFAHHLTRDGNAAAARVMDIGHVEHRDASLAEFDRHGNERSALGRRLGGYAGC